MVKLLVVVTFPPNVVLAPEIITSYNEVAPEPPNVASAPVMLTVPDVWVTVPELAMLPAVDKS